MSKCVAYSPTKTLSVSGGSPVKITGLKSLNTSLNNENQPPTTPPKPKTATPSKPLEMPDLESIIREFEMGYHSPSKRDGASEVVTPKSKNFVKKLVAAFEVKYKSYNDQKTQQQIEEEEAANLKELALPKRRSRIFSSPFSSGSDDSKDTTDSPNKSQGSKRRSGIFYTPTKYSALDSKMNRRSGIFGSPFKFLEDDGQDRGYASRDGADESVPSSPQETKSNSSWSGIFSSPFNRSKDSDKSSVYATPISFQTSKDSGSSSSISFRSDKEECKESSRLMRWSGLDDTITFESVDMDVTLPEPDETIFVEDYPLVKTSTMIDEFDRAVKEEVVRDPPRVRFVDRTPKVVGAFLKTPIEVEDTSIEWIPITGKKLPRKRSLKKLLTSWVSKPFDKSSSQNSSERIKPTKKDAKEMQDSGYDEERSVSLASSASLMSINYALEQQENEYVVPMMRSTLSTFRSRKRHENAKNAAFQNVCPTPCKQKKLVLAEVPREELKVDLGPAYPLPRNLQAATLVRQTQSSLRNATTNGVPSTPELVRLPRLPKHPGLMSIPKHPFVALTKFDDTDDEEAHGTDEPVVIIRNNMYQVEFWRSCMDINQNVCDHCSSSSMESMYDVPRPHLSLSEPKINEVELRRQYEPVYDVPRNCFLDRPRSSIYEDVVALKRRNEHQSLSSFYSSPEDVESQYATVNPRYRMLCRSRDAMLNLVPSVEPLTCAARL
ncbi:uncharacterized protein LOC144474279 isoform X2 [Augochlora pura]